MQKRVHFSNKIQIYEIPEKEQYNYYKLKEIDKKKIYNLYDVKYSRNLMMRYDTIQNNIFKLLNNMFKNKIKIHPPIKINRTDVFWTEDNSPISFMKYILDKKNLNTFCNDFDIFITKNMKIKNSQKVKYKYKHHHFITFNLIERLS